VFGLNVGDREHARRGARRRFGSFAGNAGPKTPTIRRCPAITLI
jgi:hypothetical protein